MNNVTWFVVRTKNGYNHLIKAISMFHGLSIKYYQSSKSSLFVCVKGLNKDKICNLFDLKGEIRIKDERPLFATYELSKEKFLEELN